MQTLFLYEHKHTGRFSKSALVYLQVPVVLMLQFVQILSHII